MVRRKQKEPASPVLKWIGRGIILLLIVLLLCWIGYSLSQAKEHRWRILLGVLCFVALLVVLPLALRFGRPIFFRGGRRVPADPNTRTKSLVQTPEKASTRLLDPFQFWPMIIGAWLGVVVMIVAAIRSFSQGRWIRGVVLAAAVAAGVLSLALWTRLRLRRRKRLTYVHREGAKSFAKLPKADWSGAVLSEKSRGARERNDDK